MKFSHFTEVPKATQEEMKGNLQFLPQAGLVGYDRNRIIRPEQEPEPEFRFGITGTGLIFRKIRFLLTEDRVKVSRGSAQPVQDMILQEPGPTQDKPKQPEAEDCPTQIREPYMTRDQDLSQLDIEIENIKQQAKTFNMNLTKRMSRNNLEGRPNEVIRKTDEVKIFGNVNLTEDEMELLKLGPGYMVVAQLTEEEMRTESTVSMTKMRWDKLKKGQEDMTGKDIEKEENEMTEEELLEQMNLAEALDRETRDVLDENGTRMNMGRRRATDMKGNRKVIMPPPSRPIVEAEHHMRAATWQKEFDKYRGKHCDKLGNQVESNLTRQQRLGLKSLGRKVAKVECIVLEADKGKTFVVVDEETYIAMSQDHVADDEVIDQQEVKESQAILSATATSLCNIVGLGKSHTWKNYIRCFENSGSKAEDVPNLKLMPKVHKPPNPAGHPQSRPVVAAATGLSSRAGDMLSDILEPLVTTDLPRQEDLSTEEAISQLREAEDTIRSRGLKDTMAGSLDVRALYPSLDQEAASQGVAKFVLNSKTEIDGIDWREVQVFLASNLDPHAQKKEKIQHLLPGRLKRGGCRPGQKTDELSKRSQDTRDPGSKPKVSKWATTDPDNQLSDSEKRLLFSIVCKVATLQIFKHHVYSFGGVPRRQARGGPIGLRFTSLVARILMDQWVTGFLVAVTDAGLEIHACIKYVDNVNLVVSRLPLGTRWTNGSFVVTPETLQADLDNGRTREHVTIEAVREAADSIMVCLTFTSDIPERHENGMVPMLDIQVWVSHPPGDLEGGADTLCWTYFEKPTASVNVLRASTAYSWRSKIVTLSMETFRRMRNMSRQVLTWS